MKVISLKLHEESTVESENMFGRKLYHKEWWSRLKVDIGDEVLIAEMQHYESGIFWLKTENGIRIKEDVARHLMHCVEQAIKERLRSGVLSLL